MKFLTRKIFIVLAGLLFASQPVFAGEPLKIVTTTSVLASLAQEIAGDHAEVFYVASPKRDIHKVTPTPKDVLKTRKADVFIYHGLQAEPWLLPLLNAVGKNAFLEVGGNSIDASKGIEPLEVPSEVTRLEGDIHPHGNPHYWVDPHQAQKMATTITKGLSRIRPSEAAFFQKQNEAFQAKLEGKLSDWSRRMQPFKGTPVVTYHRSWSYFAKAFDLEVVGEIEPKPGIPVTSKHLGELKSQMKTREVKLILIEPHQKQKIATKLAKVTGAQVAQLIQFTKAVKGVEDYLSLIDYNVTQIEKALREGA